MRTNNLVLELTYHEVARRLLLKQQPREIAEAMHMRIEALNTMLKRREFRCVFDALSARAHEPLDQAIDQRSRNIRREIEDHAAFAFDKLKDLLSGAHSEVVQKDIAQDFLDRAGFAAAAPTQPQIQVVINPLEAEVIASALDRERQGRERLEQQHVTIEKKHADKSSRPPTK